MNTREKVLFLRALQDQGVELVLRAPSPGGVQNFVATPDQAARLLEDRNQVLAELWGVKKHEYIGWAADQNSVWCTGETTSGRQCRNRVENAVSPARWSEIHADALCHVHEDDSSW